MHIVFAASDCTPFYGWIRLFGSKEMGAPGPDFGTWEGAAPCSRRQPVQKDSISTVSSIPVFRA